ncbi:ABC transporter permease subunit [Lachnospiraceae bacterium 54-53]
MEGQLKKKILRYKEIYLLLIPVLIYFLVFSYYPLVLGIWKSFQKVKLLGGYEMVGVENYGEIFRDRQYRQAFANSLAVGGGTFLLQFVWGLVIALLLNEIRNKVLKSLVQTVTYIPYLLSWSVVGGLWIAILAPSGMGNGILTAILGDSYSPVVFMSEGRYARAIMIFTGAWKSAGYFAALFLAAMVGIDGALYESARMDGASRIQQIRYITLPVTVPTMKVVAVLSVMGILRNFDQIFVMMNASISDQVKNLLVLIYEQGILQFNVGTAAAAATVVLLATLMITTAVKKLLKYDEIYS